MAQVDELEEEEIPEFDAGICFPIQDGGFSFRKTFTKMNSKKLSGTVDFRLRTCVTKALLKENKCDERKLQRNIAALTHTQNKREHAQNHQQLSFTFHLRRKRESWQREDRFRMDRLNFPHLSANDRKLHSASIQQVYKTPDNFERKKVSVPLLPVMYGEMEPRIVEYKNHTYITKHPAVYELHPQQQSRYDKYRGVNLLASRSVLDQRFQKLSTALSDAKLTVGSGRMEKPKLNLEHGSRFTKRSQFFPSTDNSGLQGRNYLTRATTTMI